MALATVAANQRHFINPSGAPLFIFGVNYLGAVDRTWQLWEANSYDAQRIAQDFSKARNSGFNVVRLFAHGALLDELQANNFDKLDETLGMALESQLYVLLVLDNVATLDLNHTGELIGKIGERYNDVDTLFGLDVSHEPVFYNLAAARYPSRPAPIQTEQLFEHYAERVSRDEAAALQRQGHVPAHLDSTQAYCYINGLRLFLEYDEAVRDFARLGKGSVVDFMLSPDAEPWYPFITILDGTVEDWITAHLTPLRQAGSNHLVTMGWHWLHFAALPANRALDFQSYHNDTVATMAGFEENANLLATIRKAFPKHPIVLSQFGWSNQSSSQQTNSQPINDKRTGLYEAATFAYLRSHDFGGGFKWTLNDALNVDNPQDSSFGAFRADDEPKPIAPLVQHFSTEWPAVPSPVRQTLTREVQAGLAYRVDTTHQIVVGGAAYQDDLLSW